MKGKGKMENNLKQKVDEMETKVEDMLKAIEVWEKKLQELGKDVKYIKDIEDWQRRDDLFFEELRQKDEQQKKGEL